MIMLFAFALSHAQHSPLKTDTSFLQNFSKKGFKSCTDQSKILQSSGLYRKRLLPSGVLIETTALESNGLPLVYATANLNAAKTISTDKVWAGGSSGLSLNGNGITLGIWDGGKVRTTHQEFGTRANQIDGSTSLSSHATHVAGTMMASGVSAQARGMAGSAQLHAYDWNFDVPEMSLAAASGLLISNHSYRHYGGWGPYWINATLGTQWCWFGDTTLSATKDWKFGYYHSSARQLDQISNSAPYYLMVIAASNDRGETSPNGKGYIWNGSEWVYSSIIRPPDGPYDCIPTFANAKNILTVGSVSDIPGGYTQPSDVIVSGFSCFGPTDDGRIKPDIVANGVDLYSCNSTADNAYYNSTGTSMATPNASGSMALIQEHYHNIYGQYMPSALLKSLVIQTADEAGPANGPDYSHGWGLMNTANAINTITQNGITSLMIHENLVQAQTYTLEVYSDGTSPLKTTVSWNDPAAQEPAYINDPTTLMLMNDLDVRISKQSSQWLPWVLNPASPAAAATTGDNFRDNVEQCLIQNPTAGIYTITIAHKGTLVEGSQDFALIINGIQNLAPLNFLALPVSASQINLSWSLNNAKPVLLAYSENGVFGNPLAGTNYSVGNSIPGGGIVLYTGSNTSYQHTGLSAASMHYYKIWSQINSVPEYSTGIRAQAQTDCAALPLPYEESFASTFLPSCFQIERIGNTEGWTVKNSSLAGGSAYELYHSWEDLYGTLGGSGAPSATSRIILPAINTQGISQLSLRFRQRYKDASGWNGNGTVTLKIQSSSNGTTWTDESWSYTSGSGDIAAGWKTLSITNHLNVPKTYIAFTITGDLYDFWYWAVDNLSVYEGPAALWTGLTSSAWETPTNWSGSELPTNTSLVLIPDGCANYPQINAAPASPLICSSLEVEASASLTINEGKALTVSGALINRGTSANIMIKNRASLIHSGAVTATVESMVSGGTAYHYICSPVLNPTAISAFPPWAFMRKYDESQAENQWINIVGADPLLPAIGYATYLPQADVLASYSGILNQGDFSLINLSFTPNSTPDYDGYHLVGNPYPSGINLESAGITFTNMDNTAWFWNPQLNGGLGGYASYTRGIGGINGGTQYIAPGQGFFVKTTSAGINGSLYFGNVARTHLASVFYKTTSPMLRFTVEKGEYADEAALNFLTDARENYDGRHDALKLELADIPCLYFPSSEGYKLGISSVKDLGTEGQILQLLARESGTFTLKISGTSSFERLYLRDHLLLTNIDLKKDTLFTFEVENPAIARTFSIHAAAPGTQEILPKKAKCYFDGEQIVIDTYGVKSEVSIYDAQGKVLDRFSINAAKKLSAPIQRGYLFIRISNRDYSEGYSLLIN